MQAIYTSIKHLRNPVFTHKLFNSHNHYEPIMNPNHYDDHFTGFIEYDIKKDSRSVGDLRDTAPSGNYIHENSYNPNGR